MFCQHSLRTRGKLNQIQHESVPSSSCLCLGHFFPVECCGGVSVGHSFLAVKFNHLAMTAT